MSEKKKHPIQEFSIEVVFKDSDHPMARHVKDEDGEYFVTTSTGGMISASLFFQTYKNSKFYVEYNGEYDGFNND